MNRKPRNITCHALRSPWLCLLFVLVATTSCEALFKQWDGAQSESAHPGANTTLNGDADDGRREVVAYLDFMAVLDGADEQGWHSIFEHSLNAFQEQPTRERRLRLALVMSRADTKSAEPGVTRNMLADSRKLFDDTLNDAATTPPLVRKFVRLMLSDIDTRLALYAELQSLRSQLARAHQASQTAQRDRTEAEARMRRIDAALAEANAKLEAVMKIERNIGPTGKETFP
jgi:hypothetical protein